MLTAGFFQNDAATIASGDLPARYLGAFFPRCHRHGLIFHDLERRTVHSST